MRKKVITIVVFFITLGIASSIVFLSFSRNKQFSEVKGEGEANTPRGIFSIQGEKEGEGTTLVFSGNRGQATLDITSKSGKITAILSKFEANSSLYDYKSQKIQSTISGHTNKSIAIHDLLEKSHTTVIPSRYGGNLYVSGSIEASPLLGKHDIGYRGGLQSYCIPYLHMNGIGRYCIVYGHLDININDIILKRSTIQGSIKQF